MKTAAVFLTVAISFIGTLFIGFDPNKISLTVDANHIIATQAQKVLIEVNLSNESVFPILISHGNSLVYYMITSADSFEQDYLELTVLKYGMIFPGRNEFIFNINVGEHQLSPGGYYIVFYSIFSHNNEVHRYSLALDLTIVE